LQKPPQYVARVATVSDATSLNAGCSSTTLEARADEPCLARQMWRHRGSRCRCRRERDTRPFSVDHQFASLNATWGFRWNAELL